LEQAGGIADLCSGMEHEMLIRILPPSPARSNAVLDLRAPATRLLPGLVLCGAVTAVALGIERAEAELLGRAWLEALVLAILLGTLVRTISGSTPACRAGVDFAAKTLLEVAVACLGATVSLGALGGVGPALLLGIVGIVAFAILASFMVGRLLGLSPQLAVLVACGNSICGNSAIAAVAPAIGAGSEDVTASVAFTAVLGIPLILALPLVMPVLGYDPTQLGVLAGLTVYAVPQVLAATAPAGTVAVQVGTLVKLTRVLMLAPVVLCVSLLARRSRQFGNSASLRPPGTTGPHLSLARAVPWFILVFLGLATLHSLGVLPSWATTALTGVSGTLTIISMAGLGLGVDARAVVRAGLRVTAAVTVSLVMLGMASVGLIHWLAIS
jgi:uncharacterized integral membrane protein (TIGR00698 family)